MKILSHWRAVIAVARLTAFPRALAHKRGRRKSGQPAVAGHVLSGRPEGTREEWWTASLRRPRRRRSKDVVALVAPHAGYVYSGPVAAYSYALLKGRKFERVVVIAPSHFEAFGFAVGLRRRGLRHAARPGSGGPGLRRQAGRHEPADPALRARAHAIAGPAGARARSAACRFLQRVLGQFQLVPIIMGDQSYEACRALGVALAKLIAGTGHPDRCQLRSLALSPLRRRRDRSTTRR